MAEARCWPVASRPRGEAPEDLVGVGPSPTVRVPVTMRSQRMSLRHIFWAVLFCATPALAAEPGRALRFEGGFFGPFGFAGVGYSQPLGEVVGLEGGVGVGLTGAQVPLLLRGWFGANGNYFTAAFGPSLSALPESLRAERAQGRGALLALWLNGELGYERRLRGRFNFLAAAGVDVPVATNSVAEEPVVNDDLVPIFDFGDADDWVSRPIPRPYLRLAFGYAF